MTVKVSLNLKHRKRAKKNRCILNLLKYSSFTYYFYYSFIYIIIDDRVISKNRRLYNYPNI